MHGGWDRRPCIIILRETARTVAAEADEQRGVVRGGGGVGLHHHCPPGRRLPFLVSAKGPVRLYKSAIKTDSLIMETATAA